MIKVNLNQAKATKPKRMPAAAYNSFAMHLVTTYSNDKGEISAANLKKFQAQLETFKNGEPTAKGYTVYVKWLMGAISKISPELADALANGYESETKESEYF